MLKGVVQRYAPNVMMTKLEQINVGTLQESMGRRDARVQQVLPLHSVPFAAARNPGHSANA